MRGRRRRLLRLACLSRLALVLYAIAADALLPDHDAEVRVWTDFMLDSIIYGGRCQLAINPPTHRQTPPLIPLRHT